MNRKHVGKLLSIPLMMTLLASTLPLGALAEDYDQQLNEIHKKQEVQQQKKEEAESRIQDFSQRLKVVQDELAVANKELAAIMQKRQAVEKAIQENEAQLKEAQARYNKRMKILEKRVRDIYENGQLSYLDVILGAKNFNDFANRVELFKRIINSDITLINQIQDEKKIIEDKKVELEKNRQEVVALQKDAEAKKAVIVKKRDEEAALLQKAETDKALALEALEGLERASNAIQEKLQALQNSRNAGDSSPAVQGTGQLGWPVNGPITSPFGYRYHPIWQRNILHSGIDIGVPEGTTIHAADSGVVELAGWISGYGYTVIIDHGNGLATLYAHDSQILVSVGQHISKGQAIAYSGMTGWATGPHVHFEVRRNGVPVNPMEYL